jgi:hypothetical protein
MLCAKCKGKGLCGKPCLILQNFQKFQPKVKEEFSGSCPPEIFVGRHSYPNVFAGIISPAEHGDTEQLSMPELWHKNNSQIFDILSFRSRMIYSRFKSDIYSVQNPEKFMTAMQEVAIASKPAEMEFKLEKKPTIRFHAETRMPIIGNPAPLKAVRFTENIKVERKVDYLVNDTDVKSRTAMQEMHGSGIQTSSIIKLLSAGLLGEKKNRKLVPTRWAITATDSNISELMLKEIRYFPIISDYLLFNAEYLGNHYEIILLPQAFSFEVLEAKMQGSVWNPSEELHFMIDYETWYGRKNYAENVTGGYYAVRLPAAEYLTRVRKQAGVLVMRECRPEYNIPCGVGILRETVRGAFSKKPEKFSTLNETINQARTRLKLPIEEFTKVSTLLKEKREQKTLNSYLIKV